MNQIILYGLAGADVQYVAVKYFIVNEKFMSIDGLIHTANYMITQYPTIEHIYAIDNRPGLRKEYSESVRNKKNPIEARMVFRDTLEREGLRII